MFKSFLSSSGLSSANEPHLLPQRKTSALLTAAAEWLSLASVVIVPLIFLMRTGQSQDFVKQIALLALMSVAVLCWVGSMLVNKKLSLRRTVANPVVLLLLATTLISALLSGARYLGMVGGDGQEYQSFMTTLLFAAFFFVVTNLPSGANFARRVIFCATFVGGLVSLFALFQYSGVYLIPGVNSPSFNPIGSTVILGLFAAVTVVMAAASFLESVNSKKLALVKHVAVGFFGACALVLAITINFWPIWAAIIIGLLVVMILATIRPHAINRLMWLAVPMLVLVIAALFLLIKIPFPISAPTEVFPTLKQSIDVARGSLISHPIFGAGPGTYLQEFALHRSIDLNQNYFWYVQFDRAMSFLATVASTMGVAGLVAWLAVFVIGLWKSAAYLIASRKMDDASWVSALAIAAAWFASAAGIIIYGASLPLLFLFWILFTVLIRSTSTESVEVGFSESPRSGLVLTFAFVILIVLALSGWFVSGTRLYADATLANSSSLDLNTSLDTVISKLENAFRTDPQSDLTARNLSKAYLLKIQQLFSDTKLDPAVRNPQVQNLTSNAVKAGTVATQLNPMNIQNWTQLGAVYEAIAAYVSGASDQAIKAYARAAELDPTSPLHPTSIGRVNLAIAKIASDTMDSAKDDATKAADKKVMDDSLVSAIAAFQNALKLKSDYGMANYQIALAYDAQGKTKEAIASLEKVLLANTNDIGVGFEMASLYYRDGQKDKAQAELERLIKQQPDFANGRWLLATVYEEDKRYDDAIAQLQEILKTNKDNKDVQTKLQTLQDEKAGKTPAAGTAPTPPVLP